MKPNHGQKVKQEGDELKALFFFDDWLLHAREGLDRKQGQCSLLKEVKIGTHPELSSIYALRFYYDKWLDHYVMYVDCTHKGDKDNQGNFTFRLDTDDLCNWPIPEWVSGNGPLWNRVKNPVLDQNGKPLYYFDVLCLAGTPMAEKGYFMNIYEYNDNGKSINSVIAFSKDGLHWVVDTKTRWLPHLSDTCNPPLYNPRTGQFMIFCRPGFVDRRIALVKTDLKTFSPATTILQPDVEDPVCREFYGLNPMFYDGIFVGVLQIYDTEPTENTRIKMHGTNEVQLAYSYNGQNWYRASRQTFFSRTGPGTTSGGSVYLGAPVLTKENRIVFCVTPSWAEHGLEEKDFPAEYNPRVSTYLYDMRLDGFIYLKTRARQGLIQTKTVISQGGELNINFRTLPSGYIKVAVLDGTQNADTFGKPLPNYTLEDAIPATGDELFGKIIWQNRNNLDELKDKPIMLQVHVCEGELYSLRFPYQVLIEIKE